jgi:hypothetical protein
MYFPASERIARNHSAAAAAIEGLDRLIYETGGHPLRPSATADLLGIRLPLLERILNQYVQEQLLRPELRFYCRDCDLLLEDQDDALWCDACERTRTNAEVHEETAFAPVDPILRIDVDPDSDPPGGLTVIQFIAGDRGGSQQSQVQAPREYREIRDALDASSFRSHLSLTSPIHAATAFEISIAYRQHPKILHFAGHGDDRSLSVIQDRGTLVTARPLTADQLQTILQNFPQRVGVCVLNTCDSLSIATPLTSSGTVDIAIAWQGKVPDAVAVEFSRVLYRHLGEGISFLQAFNLAKACTENGVATAHILHAATVQPQEYFAISV